MTRPQSRRECHVLAVGGSVHHKHIRSRHLGALAERHPLVGGGGGDLEEDVALAGGGGGFWDVDLVAKVRLRTFGNDGNGASG